MSEDLHVNRNLDIPADEIELKFTPSGGPGGQHANKASTRVEVSWNVATSNALGPRQRQRIKEKLRHRIDNNGVLRVASDTQRSQLRNREDALARMSHLIADALKPTRKRIPTGPSKGAKERRLSAKRRRSEVKKQRQKRFED
jgi:ribosome-associated protein